MRLLSPRPTAHLAALVARLSAASLLGTALWSAGPNEMSASAPHWRADTVQLDNLSPSSRRLEARSPRERREHALDASLVAAVEIARYRVYQEPRRASVWTAHNRAHQMSATFTLSGVDVQSRGNRVGLELRSIGYGARQRRLIGGDVRVDGSRVEIARSGLTEWYVNTAAGLEQGFTIDRAPGERSSDERLRLVMAVEGDLVARNTERRQAVDFVTTRGERVLRYEKLLVIDAAGQTLDASMIAAGDELAIDVADAEAVYPVTIDPTFTQQAYLKASNTDALDNFGVSVAISGDTAVVGADAERSNATGVDGDQSNDSVLNAGAAYVFVRSAGVWTQQAYLKASNTGSAGDAFGRVVAISGDTIVIGASGEDSNATGVNGNQADTSAPFAGAAYVFRRTGGTWSQEAYLKASNTASGDQFGHAVGVSGDIIAVGAINEDSDAVGVDGDADNDDAENAGAAYVFVRSGGAWSQQAYLKASNAADGDNFGWSLAVSDETIVVGSPFEDSGATGVGGDQADDTAADSGAAYVFVRSGGAWSQQAYLKASNTGDDDRFGLSVSAMGDRVVVGAFLEDSDATGVDGDQSNDDFGNAGAAYVFARSGGTWSQTAYLKSSYLAFNSHWFGSSVGISEDAVIVGARLEPSGATGVDGDQTNNGAFASGAAYVFGANTAPTLTAGTPSTPGNSPAANVTIATVGDLEDDEDDLVVTVNGGSSAVVNGVTVSNIQVDAAGTVTADIAAACGATTAQFTLKVTDTGELSTEGTLTVTVTLGGGPPSVSASVEKASLWPVNHQLINVGLTATAVGACAPVSTLDVQVFSNEDDEIVSTHSPDAKSLALGALRLRSERNGLGQGRVYLIVVTATDAAGNVGIAVATVIVPIDTTAGNVTSVTSAASAAAAFALANGGAPPPGYVVVGDGPILGPRQ